MKFNETTGNLSHVFHTHVIKICSAMWLCTLCEHENEMNFITIHISGVAEDISYENNNCNTIFQVSVMITGCVKLKWKTGTPYFLPQNKVLLSTWNQSIDNFVIM